MGVKKTILISYEVIVSERVVKLTTFSSVIETLGNRGSRQIVHLQDHLNLLLDVQVGNHI